MDIAGKYLECGKCIRRDVECRYFNVFKEQIEVVGVHDDACKGLVPETLSQHDPAF